MARVLASTGSWAAPSSAARWFTATLLDYIHRDDPWDGDFVRRTLEGVSRLPSVRKPVFAFVHVLSPHWPFVFDRNCHLPPRYVIGRRAARPVRRRSSQCLNRMVLATVTHLIRDSDVPPVILLQGDHGSGLRGFKSGTPGRRCYGQLAARGSGSARSAPTICRTVERGRSATRSLS